MSVIEWKQASVAGVRLRRFTGHVGGIEVGSVEFDGSNRLWTWSSPFAEDVWGHAPTQAAHNRRCRLGCVGGLRSSVPCSIRRADEMVDATPLLPPALRRKEVLDEAAADLPPAPKHSRSFHPPLMDAATLLDKRERVEKVSNLVRLIARKPNRFVPFDGSWLICLVVKDGPAVRSGRMSKRTRLMSGARPVPAARPARRIPAARIQAHKPASRARLARRCLEAP